MPNTAKPIAERIGYRLGRLWRSYVRRERQVTSTLVERGVPARAAAALLWIVKLVVLGVLVYAAFWLALIMLFAVLIFWVVTTPPVKDDNPEPEWCLGPDGYGLYRGDVRIDVGDPEQDD